MIEKITANDAVPTTPTLLAAAEAVLKWMEDSGLDKTKSGGVGPLTYKGTEYSVVTDLRAAIAKANA